MENKIPNEEELLGGAVFSPENPIGDVDEEMVLADDDVEAGGGEVVDEVGGVVAKGNEENEIEKDEKGKNEERKEETEGQAPPPPAPPLPPFVFPSPTNSLNSSPTAKGVEMAQRRWAFPGPSPSGELTKSQKRNMRRARNFERWQALRPPFNESDLGLGGASSTTPKSRDGGESGVAGSTPTTHRKRKEVTPTGVSPPLTNKRQGMAGHVPAAVGRYPSSRDNRSQVVPPSTNHNSRNRGGVPSGTHPTTIRGCASSGTHPKNRGGVGEKSTYKESTVCTPIQVAYVKECYRMIPEAEFLQFKKALEEKVLLHLLENEGSLNFGRTCLKEDGRIVVPCHDQLTVDFVVSTVPKILEGKFGAWSVKDQPEGLGRRLLSGFLVDFDPKIHDSDDFLKHLAISNKKELGVDSWQVVKILAAERRGELGSYIWLNIPKGCLSELEKLDMRPKFLLRRMTRLEFGYPTQPYKGAVGGPSGKKTVRDG